MRPPSSSHVAGAGGSPFPATRMYSGAENVLSQNQSPIRDDAPAPMPTKASLVTVVYRGAPGRLKLQIELRS